MSETTTSTPDKTPPAFYTRDSEDFKGTKIALWFNKKSEEEGSKAAQLTGTIGGLWVQLWEQTSARGPFYNVKADGPEGKLAQIGNANAFINANGYNALSVSLKFDSEAAANAFKEANGVKDVVKPYTKDGATSYFVNCYADVSKRAIEANPAEFERLGFKTEIKAKTAKP